MRRGIPNVTVRRGCPAALLMLLVASATAQAAPKWQAPEAWPAGLATSHPKPVVLPDGSGSFLGESIDGVRLVHRKVGGATTVSSSFPVSGGAYQISLSRPAANGDLLAYRALPAFVPGGTGATFGPVEPHNDSIGLLSVAPSGEAVATFSGTNTYVSFRPAGVAGRFDAGTDRVLPPAAGDAYASPLGLVLDPDGGVFVVYESLPNTKAILQTYAPPGQNFQTPVQLSTPLAEPSTLRFGAATNGYGVLAWAAKGSSADLTTSRIVAAVRPPGGLLGVPGLVKDQSSDPKLPQASLSAVAMDSGGHAYLGFTAVKTQSGCPDLNDQDAGARLAVGTGTGQWSVSSLGGDAWPATSGVADIETAGTHVAVAVLDTTDTGARCAQSAAATDINARIGDAGSLGPPATLVRIDQPTAMNDYVGLDGLAIGTNGNALALVSGAGRGKQILAYEDRGPAPTPTPKPKPKPLPPPGRLVTHGTIKVDGTQLPLKASCGPPHAGVHSVACRLVAVAQTFKANAVAQRGRASRGQLIRLGGVTATIPAGRARTIKLRLNAVARKALRKHHQLQVRLTVTITAGKAKTKIARTIKLVLTTKHRRAR